MQRHGIGSTLPLRPLLRLLSLTCIATAAISKEEHTFEVTYAEAIRDHQQEARDSDRTDGSPAQRAPVEQEGRAQGGEPSPRLRASQKIDGAVKKDTTQDEQGMEFRDESPASLDSHTGEAEDGHGASREAGGRRPDDASSESTLSTSEKAENAGSFQTGASHDSGERPAGQQSIYRWRVFAEAPTDLPLFGDMQQFSFPRFDATQFPGFTSLPSIIGRSDSTKLRDIDGSSFYQSLFDLSGFTNPLFSLGDVLRAGEAAGATPINWSPILSDLRLPGRPDFGKLRNATISLPGLGGRGGFSLGPRPAEFPFFSTFYDLLQDPLNVEELHVLFKDALIQLQENPLNADRLRDTVDEIVQRVTPQESIALKQVIRAYREQDARRIKILAEAILDGANRVGQQLKSLKEVSVGGSGSSDGEVSASGSSLTSLGDIKEVLDIEDAFARFRGALEQLLAPVVNVLPAFSPPSWTPSASPQVSTS